MGRGAATAVRGRAAALAGLTLGLGLGLGMVPGLPAAAQDIGTVASSEPVLTGTPPGAAARALDLGTGVVQDERIASSPDGRGQILFVDQTTLSLAPNTVIVLDSFVFNPDGSGQMGLSLAGGALRFIGGALSRQQEATVATPTATIGIRGSSALILHARGETIAVFLAGERLCLTTQSGRRACTSRAGGVLTEEGYGGRVAPEFLAQILGLIDGAPQPGGAGGAGTGGLGTGIGDAVPPGRGPVSTGGEEFDPDLFVEDFTLDQIVDFLSEDGGFNDSDSFNGNDSGVFLP